LSAQIPNCVSYDPTYSFELAVIIQDGLRRMYEEQESVFYYVTVMNENYVHPAMPEGVREGIVKGMYLLKDGHESGPGVQLIGSGTILREVEAAADLLHADFAVNASVWSAPSFTELRREADDVRRWNMLHPEDTPRTSYVQQCLESRQGPVVAATDYVKLFADQIREFVPKRYVVLGTDGYGRSDVRAELRKFFEVNRYYIVIAALTALADEGEMPRSRIKEAIDKYGIDPEKPNPQTV
ncbi:MAG: pyruvate dehydrogenase E1 component, partial [Gammaproteobacteria bacterium]